MNSCTLLLKPRERLQEQQWSLEAWLLFPFCRSPLPQGPALSPSPVFLWSPGSGLCRSFPRDAPARAQVWSSFDTASGEAAPAS